jgi:membrane protein required for colicin V production
MHWLDIVLLVVLGIGVVLGARSGLLWQVARIVTFGVAIYATVFGNGLVVAQITPYLTDWSPMAVQVLAYVGTFLAVYLALFGVTLLLEKALKAAKLKTLDRVLGGLFGLVKAGLLAGAVLMGVALVATPDVDAALAESRVAPVLLTAMRGVIVAVPQDYKDQLNAAIDRVKKQATDQAGQLGEEAARKAVEDQLNPKPAPTGKAGPAPQH